MSEHGEIGGVQQANNEKQLYVAVRSMDRQTFYSPTQNTPDFFTFSLQPDTMPLENRVGGMMRTHHGIIVYPDQRLVRLKDEPDVIGEATYLRHVVDYEAVRDHGKFTVRDIRDARHDLLAWSKDTSDTFTPEEQRIFRIKEALFQQVISLFETRGPRGPEHRR